MDSPSFSTVWTGRRCFLDTKLVLLKALPTSNVYALRQKTFKGINTSTMDSSWWNEAASNRSKTSAARCFLVCKQRNDTRSAPWTATHLDAKSPRISGSLYRHTNHQQPLIFGRLGRGTKCLLNGNKISTMDSVCIFKYTENNIQ